MNTRTIVRGAEVVLALVPATLFAAVIFPLAFASALGVGFAMAEHVRAGDPFWRSDLMQIGLFIGSSIAGSIGVLGLWVCVLRHPEGLAERPLQWWATIIALVMGLTTALAWLSAGAWPWSSLTLSYPLTAASVVASYGLLILILGKSVKRVEHRAS